LAMPRTPPPKKQAPATQTPDEAARDAVIHELALNAMGALRAVQHLATRAFEPLDLSPSQAVVITMIAAGTQSPKALSERLETVQSAVTAWINDLVEKGLLARQPDPRDGRRVQLHLTARGQATLSKMGEIWLRHTTAQLQGVSIADLQATARVVRHLTEGRDA
jgi:DNA-binding MarR family transcriptional regulator